jgi:anti-sigma factor RsiW
VDHPSQATLSAYVDGELAPAEVATLDRHTLACAACAEAVSAFVALDRELADSPLLSCGAALALVSAQADGELDPASAKVAEAHLAGCAGCRGDASAWGRLDAALAALPLEAPSARVDVALERYRREPVPAGRRPLFGPTSLPLRAAVAVAVAIALLVAVPQQPGPEIATPAPEAAIVASVFDTRSGTLYVLHSQEGLVAALDAVTLAPRSVISVGGRPTALALSERTDEVLVLDGEAKTLTSISTVSNTVVATQTVAVPGTPTSLQVDGTGKVHVASVIAEVPGGGPAPSAAASAKPLSGAVTVIDPATKKVETVNQLDVAPRQMIIEPGGKRALLVSSQGTTLVDAATYRPIERVAGGIAATFSASSPHFAILSQRNGGAFVSFSAGPGVALKGAARAIAPLSDGGYAVLTDVVGQGRIAQFNAEGTLQTEVNAPAGTGLTFDRLTGKLAVIGTTGVQVVALPGVTAAAPSSEPANPSIVVTVPSPSAPASAAPSVSPGTSAAPSASPSASPGVSASPAPSEPVAAKEPVERPSLVPTGARLLTGDTYLYEPAKPGRATRVAGDAARIWAIDGANQLSALHTATGEVFTVASLPKAARITSILPSPGYVYLTDATNGALYVVSVRNERWTAHPMPFLPLVVDAVTSPDDRLWLVVDGFGLVSFDPRTRSTDIVDVGGTRFSALGVDLTGRVLLAPRDRGVLDIYDPLTAKLTELVFPHEGSITAIAVDPKGGVWVGTDTGQVLAMRGSRVETVAGVGRAIDRLVVSASGEVWYVSRAGGEVTFGPAARSALALHGPGGMSMPVFDVFGRAWAQDPASGAFFVTLPAGGR